jgi:hypothetical protein
MQKMIQTQLSTEKATITMFGPGDKQLYLLHIHVLTCNAHSLILSLMQHYCADPKFRLDLNPTGPIPFNGS